MQSFVYPVVSVEGTNFTEALAQHAASAMNNLVGVPAITSRRFLLRAILAITKENYAPEFNFFSKAAGFTADPATDFAISRWGFAAASGEQLGGAGLWRYYVDGLAIPYVDLDTIGTVNPPTLHVILQNQGAIGKSAGAAGATQVTFWLEPMQSY